jgi:hypothetical protein
LLSERRFTVRSISSSSVLSVVCVYQWRLFISGVCLSVASVYQWRLFISGAVYQWRLFISGAVYPVL